MTKYYLCCTSNERKCISKDMSWTTDINRAWLFDERHKAENVMISNLGKKDLKIKSIEVKDKTKPTMVDSIEKLSEMEVPTGFIDVKLPFDLKEKYQELLKIPSLIENEEKRLNALLIRVSRALTDLAHYLEFSNNGNQFKLNASQRTKISLWEGKLFAKRREIKDNLRIISAIKGFYRVDENVLNELSKRQYSPRILEGLFETGELPVFEEWLDEESN